MNKYTRLQKTLTKFIKDNNITFVTATQVKRAHHTYPTRVPHDGPDIIVIDHINLIK